MCYVMFLNRWGLLSMQWRPHSEKWYNFWNFPLLVQRKCLQRSLELYSFQFFLAENRSISGAFSLQERHRCADGVGVMGQTTKAYQESKRFQLFWTVLNRFECCFRSKISNLSISFSSCEGLDSVSWSFWTSFTGASEVPNLRQPMISLDL